MLARAKSKISLELRRPRETQRQRAVLAAFLLLCTLSLLAFLNSVPDLLVHWEDGAIHAAVSNYARGEGLFQSLNWVWNNGALSNLQGSSTSPPMRIILGSGLRVFGLNFLGLRFFPALFSLLTVFAVFYSLKRYASFYFRVVFVSLLVSSPFFLVHARSALSAALTLDWILLSICLLEAFARHPRSLVLPVGTGLFVSLLPYFYAIGRPVALVLFVVPLFIRPFRLRRVALFYLPLLLVLSLQCSDIDKALSNFLSGSGETIFGHGIVWSIIFPKLLSNGSSLARELLGLNCSCKVAMVRILDLDTVCLYPVFLVPFFLVGLFKTVVIAIRSRSGFSAFSLVAFLFGIIPGLAVGAGYVNAHRVILLAPALYYFISVGLFEAHERIRALARFSLPLLRCAIPFLVVFSIFYQLNDYFRGVRAWFDLSPMAAITEDIEAFFREFPDETLLACLWHDDTVYHYSTVRLLGGERLAQLERQGQLIYDSKFDDLNTASLDAMHVDAILITPAWKSKIVDARKEREVASKRSGLLLLYRSQSPEVTTQRRDDYATFRSRRGTSFSKTSADSSMSSSRSRSTP